MQLIIREKLFSLGERCYSVQDDVGNKIYSIKGKLINLNNKFSIKDAAGREVAFTQRKYAFWKILHTDYEVYIAGKIYATVKSCESRLSLIDNKFDIEMNSVYNIFAEWHNGAYKFIRDTAQIATADKRSLNLVRTDYLLNIKDNKDSFLVVAIWLAIYSLLNYDQANLIYRPSG